MVAARSTTAPRPTNRACRCARSGRGAWPSGGGPWAASRRRPACRGAWRSTRRPASSRRHGVVARAAGLATAAASRAGRVTCATGSRARSSRRGPIEWTAIATPARAGSGGDGRLADGDRARRPVPTWAAAATADTDSMARTKARIVERARRRRRVSSMSRSIGGRDGALDGSVVPGGPGRSSRYWSTPVGSGADRASTRSGPGSACRPDGHPSGHGTGRQGGPIHPEAMRAPWRPEREKSTCVNPARDQPPAPPRSTASGAHGPWPDTTYGDCSTSSYVCGSVTKVSAHGPIWSRCRSNAARSRKMYR